HAVPASFPTRRSSDLVKLASYRGVRQGDISELLGLGMPLKDRHVIVVEDIVDSGRSLGRVMELLEQASVASVAVASLLLKPSALDRKSTRLNSSHVKS